MSLLQITEGKDEPNIVYMRKSQRTSAFIQCTLRNILLLLFLFLKMKQIY
jgi:hypothetical protein